jgi:hypothetical protein
MEADWAVALADDDPVIVAPWSAGPEDASPCRFIDLRRGVERIDEINEVRRAPALRAALVAINGSDSPWWTAKCDVWTSSVSDGDEAGDAYEMDAEPGEVAFGVGSYIDLLPRDGLWFVRFEQCEGWLRLVVEELRGLVARAARVDLVLRHGSLDGESSFGLSWFVEGCGSSAESAEKNWGNALTSALTAMLNSRRQFATLPCEGETR